MAFRGRGSFRTCCGDLTTEGTEEHRGKRFVGGIDCCIHIGFANRSPLRSRSSTLGVQRKTSCALRPDGELMKIFATSLLLLITCGPLNGFAQTQDSKTQDKDADKPAVAPAKKKETKKEPKKEEKKEAPAEEKKGKMTADTFAGLKFRLIGPAVASGRVMSIAVNPRKTDEYYVGVASGGVWKTVNDGTTWTPVFDGEGSYSIGWVALDPNDSSVAWVGAGESNSQRSVAYGDGIYRSVDGGKGWNNLG